MSRTITQRADDALGGAGDLINAINILVDRDLPDTPAGHEQCEQHLRDFDEGFRELWKSPDTKGYLRTVVSCAFAVVCNVREQQSLSIAQSLVQGVRDEAQQRFLHSVIRAARDRHANEKGLAENG